MQARPFSLLSSDQNNMTDEKEDNNADLTNYFSSVNSHKISKLLHLNNLLCFCVCVCVHITGMFSLD